MKIINFYASPGSGKTLISAAIFVELKKIFSAVEINYEYAKRLVYEERNSILQNNQLYIFAKQEKLFHDLKNKKIEYCITDSPLLLSIIYNNPEHLNQEIFENLVLDVYRRYENINIFIERNPKFGHDPNGRIQKTLEEATKLDTQILDMFKNFNISYHSVKNDKDITENILEIVLKDRMN